MKLIEEGGRKINVLHIIERLPLGGAENLLLVLARNIDRSRFNLSFCCLRDGGYIADRLKEEGFRVVCLQNYRMRHFHKKIIDIVRLIKAEDIDIVQTHLLEGNLWGRIGAHLSHKPLVCKTEHAVLAGSWTNGALSNKAYLITDRMQDTFSDCIIYVSEFQRRLVNMVRYSNPSIHSKHIVIHNAFDEQRFTVKRTRESTRGLLGFSDNDIVIGTVGRLVRHKGHDFLFEAVKEVRKRHSRVKMLVVGSGPEEVRLKDLAHASGVDTLFLYDRDDVPELMKSMDIFVQPSLREAFGITIAEAMYSGLPVVATNVGGIPEVVTDGETGILIPPIDSEAIAKALIYLIENPHIAKEMGRKGKEVVQSKFTGEIYATKLEKLYISLLRDKKSTKKGNDKLGGAVTNSDDASSKMDQTIKNNMNGKRYFTDFGKRSNKVKVIYITSTNFSCSTILGSILGTSVSVFNCGELKYFFNENHNEPCTCGKNLRECEFWQKIREKCQYSIDHHHSAEYKLFRSIYEEASKIRDVEYILDVSRDLHRLEMLSKISGLDLYVVCLIRDLRASVNSFMKHHPNSNFLTAIGYWMKTYLEINLFLSNAGIKYIRINYDDLCSYTSKTIRVMNSFLGIDIGDNCIGMVRNANPHVFGNNFGVGLNFQQFNRLRCDNSFERLSKGEKLIGTMLWNLWPSTMKSSTEARDFRRIAS